MGHQTLIGGCFNPDSGSPLIELVGSFDQEIIVEPRIARVNGQSVAFVFGFYGIPGPWRGVFRMLDPITFTVFPDNGTPFAPQPFLFRHETSGAFLPLAADVAAPTYVDPDHTIFTATEGGFIDFQIGGSVRPTCYALAGWNERHEFSVGSLIIGVPLEQYPESIVLSFHAEPA